MGMESHVYPTVYLHQKDFERVLTERWEPNARYAWDTGVAIGHYLQELKAGRIVGRRCDGCDRDGDDKKDSGLGHLDAPISWRRPHTCRRTRGWYSICSEPSSRHSSSTSSASSASRSAPWRASRSSYCR